MHLLEFFHRWFEGFCIYCQYNGNLVPVAFVLAFHVNRIVQRWWLNFNAIPWPDELALTLAAYTHGNSDHIRKQMGNLVRYANLSFILWSQNNSSQGRARYPTDYHLIAEGRSQC